MSTLPAQPAAQARRLTVTRLHLRDFRNYERAELDLLPGLTVVSGPNGAGKTNLLEALYFGCTGRSPRTANERELVRRGAPLARVVVETVDEDGSHTIEVGFEPGQAKAVRLDGSPVHNLPERRERPLVSVFLPERLELVKGAPSARRAHVDQVVAALWPARAGSRAAYSGALAQRNALLTRAGRRPGAAAALDAWDAELARHGVALMEARGEALAGIAPHFTELATRLGLPGRAELRYRPRSSAASAEELASEFAERRSSDLERGFTAHGPHRDEVAILLDGTPLRAYGSQGQQRTTVLALLFAERELFAASRARPPLMLLDDVMSELDGERRELLAGLLRSGGQAMVSATDIGHVPGTHPAEAIQVHAGTMSALSCLAA